MIGKYYPDHNDSRHIDKEGQPDAHPLRNALTEKIIKPDCTDKCPYPPSQPNTRHHSSRNQKTTQDISLDLLDSDFLCKENMGRGGDDRQGDDYRGN